MSYGYYSFRYDLRMGFLKISLTCHVCRGIVFSKNIFLRRDTYTHRFSDISFLNVVSDVILLDRFVAQGVS